MMFMMVLFFLVALSIWGLAHYYIARRLSAPLRHRPRLVRLIWAGAVVSFVLAPLGMVLQRNTTSSLLFDLMQWATFVAMGAFTFLFVLMVLKDLLWFVHLGLRRLRTRERTHRPERDAAPEAAVGAEGLADPHRRLFMTNSLNAAVVTAAAAGTKFGLYEARKVPGVVEVDVPIDGLPEALEGFRIVQLSDIHVGPTIRKPFVEGVVARVNELGADLIAITGDLVDGPRRRLWSDVEPLVHMKSRHGIYFATGNHDYYSGVLEWCEALEAHGVEVLINTHRLVEHDGGRLLVAGCTDYATGKQVPGHATDPEGAIAGAPEHDVSVLLAHQPMSIHAAERAGYDLQLSGHTHGGQIWPFNYIVGMVHPFAVGLGRQGKTWIYVSRGTGYWGPPMRLGAPSEITVVRLVAARRGAKAPDKADGPTV